MAKTQLAALVCSSLLLMLMASFGKTDAAVGVCYGMIGNNLPPSREVIHLYKQNGIKRMRIYGPNRDALEALRCSNIELILGIPNEHLKDVASSQAAADSWVQDNVQNYENVEFRYISVGNEVKPESPEAQYVVPAMQNIQNDINWAGLCCRIKVSTSVGMRVLGESYPPSKGDFNDSHRGLVEPVIRFLVDNESPFLANVYPYFGYIGKPGTISLDYALFRSQGYVVRDPDTNLGYQNLFDAILDALYSALEKAGGGSLNVVVSESGWPSDGGGAETTVENARTYNTKLVEHVKGGTPKRPQNATETYIFALFDENEKPGAQTERHFGLFTPAKQPKYPMNFN